ncbi:hypothetical protein ISN44_As13g002380 [Arabidopsis suecica]|uniref:DUF4283 domain-containing protein n=1 Tax=Arabidopsis suecica TaxID=45249 RepID=A0A8T1XP01_ARASU|nr:hypothetical protein ISN44_As13g002380 [Arabidopsis suecica]
MKSVSAEDSPGGAVVPGGSPDPRWPLLNRWSQPSPTAKPPYLATVGPPDGSSRKQLAVISPRVVSPRAKSPAIVPKPASAPSSAFVPSPDVSTPTLQTLKPSSPTELVATVKLVPPIDPVVPPIAPVVVGTTSNSSAIESKNRPATSLTPVDDTGIVKPRVSDSLVSPPLRGAWEKQLKFTTVSAAQQAESGVPISRPTQSQYDSSKEDDMRFPWAAKMDPAARNLYRATSPEYMEDGTPKVTIPSHVLLQGLENQKEYVLGQFYRCNPPAGGLIHAVINRIWGRKCRIFMRKLDDSKFLFHIPDASTRAWVLQRGLWHVDDCLMFVAPWSTADTFDLPEISTIPVWVTLKNIPNRLYSIPGISHIASGLGAPMATYKPRLDPSLMGEAKVLVEVELSKAFPPRIAAADKKGNISMVNVEYSWVSATCGECGQLGHKASRCMKPHLPHERVTKTVSEEVLNPAIESLSSATDLVSPISLQTEPPIAVPTADSEFQIDTALEIEAGPIQDKDNCNRVAACQTNAEAEVVTEAICTVESVNVIAGTKDNAILSDREIQHVLAENKFSRLGSFFSDGDSLSSDGDSMVSVDSESGSGLMELMTPSGQRLLRERPVKPSIKAKEIQASSNTRGRGNRGRGNRGRGNRGRG